MISNFCCCFSSRKRTAFKTDLGISFLDGYYDKLNYDSIVVNLVLESVDDNKASSKYNNVYVEFKLLPNDTIAGCQTQRSSTKPNTTKPIWEPGERFQFIVSKKETSRILLSVYDLNGGSSTPIGDGIINCKDLVSDDSKTTREIKLISPEDGKAKGIIAVEITCTTPAKARNSFVQCVYEFERWQPIIEWGSSEKHLLPTDPGRWSTIDGVKFSNNIESIAALPTNWTVVKSWYTMASSTDADGYQYAFNYESPSWFNKVQSNMNVRRRVWQREVARPFIERIPSIGIDGTNNPLKSKASGRGSSFLSKLSFNNKQSNA